MKYLPIETPAFDHTGTYTNAEVTWCVGLRNGEYKLMTREAFRGMPSQEYSAISVSDATEAAVRGWQHGIADTELDMEIGDTYANHEGYMYEPSDEVSRVYERQYEWARKYAKEQQKRETS